MSAKQTIESLWDKINIDHIDTCWPWTKGVNNSGYGVVSWNQKVYVAHRLAAWTLGLIETPEAPLDKTENGFILHACDNPVCCNPTHWDIGTYSQNQKDCYHRGRRKQPRSAHANAKLKKTQIDHIRKNKGKMRQIDLAKQHNVSQRCISLVQRYETYKDI